MIIQKITKIILSEKCYSSLIERASRHSVEACALILGRHFREGDAMIAEASEIILTENAENSRRSFSIAPDVLYMVYQYAEQTGLEIIGIFHSHPDSETPKPSQVDEAYMYYNPCVWLIAGRNKETPPKILAYQLVNKKIEQVELSKVPLKPLTP